MPLFGTPQENTKYIFLFHTGEMQNSKNYSATRTKYTLQMQQKIYLDFVLI